MSFANCISSAVDQGALERAEADRLPATHDAELTAAAARGEADPAKVAKAAVEKILDMEAAQAERRKALMADRMTAISDFGTAYRGPDGQPNIAAAYAGLLENRNNSLIGAASVMGRRDALIGLAHGQLEQGLYETRRKWGSGQRHGQVQLENIAREAFGEATGDAAAKGFLESWRKVVDKLVDAFNAAGGAVTKRDSYFPQNHVAEKLLAAGRDAWKAYIAPRLDVARMKDPLSGGALTPARLNEALDVIFDRVVTDGAIDAAPSTHAKGRGALATQRAEERFLEFKSGQDWLDYNTAFGNGDVHAAMMGHLHGLARDVATLEILGPNPDAMVTWMGSVLRQEKARADLGRPALYKEKWSDLIASDPSVYLDRFYGVIKGNLTVHNKGADAVAGLRNWLTAANLSQTALTAVAGDPAQATWARKFAGVPVFRMVRDLPSQLFGTSSARDVSRAGVIVADAMDHLRSDVGGYGLTAASNEMSRWLPDRVFAWTGLTPWTNAARRAHAQGFMFHAGDLAGTPLAALDARGGQDAKFGRWLQGFGIDEADWAVIGAAKKLDHGEAGGMIRPVDIIASAPGDAHVRDIALKYSEAIHALMEEATPGGTARARTALGMDTRKGTTGGEIVRSGGMYLSYPSTVLISLKNALAHEAAGGNAGRGIGFALKTAFTLWLGGALILQMQALRNGRDARGVDDLTFWGEALAKGGGLGFYGDWVMADYKRGGGDQAARLAGPVVGAAADALAVINPKGALGEEDTNRAERAVQFARRNVPGLNMWMIKPFTDRLVYDRLQLLANPDAYRAWQRRDRQLLKEHDQGTWWPKGRAMPERAPDLSLW